MSIIDDLNWRYAVKEFDPNKKVSKEDLETILESLRLSASSFGLQTWKFVVVETQELKDKLVEHSWNQRQVADATYTIVLCRPTSFGNDDVDRYVKSVAETRGQGVEELKGFRNMMVGFVAGMDEEKMFTWMKNQIYIALGNMLTTCAHLRIDSCPMEGFIPNKYDEVLGLTEKGLASVVVCPIGYRSTNDKYAEAKKVRFPLDEVVVRL